MSFHYYPLAWCYPYLRAVKAIGRQIGLASPHRLRVLNYHDIAPKDQENFAAQLRWLARNWIFISPKRFEAMVSGEEPIRGSNLLITFDDGFASNRVVAEQVLNPMGIRALFFAVSDFAAMKDRQEARRFIAKHIYPGTCDENLPAHLCNMGWADFEALLEQGHCVGGHTLTHARLAQISAVPDIEQEIIAGADMLEKRLGIAVEHFAYTFGDLASFSPAAMAVARRRFQFIHSGLRGDNAGITSPFVIRRDAAAQQDLFLNYSVFPNHLLGSFLEGAADFKYARDLALLGGWSRMDNKIGG